MVSFHTYILPPSMFRSCALHIVTATSLSSANGQDSSRMSTLQKFFSPHIYGISCLAVSFINPTILFLYKVMFSALALCSDETSKYSHFLCSQKILFTHIFRQNYKYTSLKIYTKKTLQEKNLVKLYTLFNHVEVSPSNGSADQKGLYRCNEKEILSHSSCPLTPSSLAHRLSLDFLAMLYQTSRLSR